MGGHTGGGADSSPDLGDYGASVTIDSSGRVRQVTATVAGVGPFEYSPGDSQGSPSQPGAPQATAQQDERVRHDIDLLQQAVQHLDSQHDGPGIAHAMVTVLTVANAAVHSSEWVESEGLAEETRHWTAVTGTEGSLETFQAAREHVKTAALHLVGILNQLLAVRDVVARSIQKGTRGGEGLRYLAQMAAYGRTRLSFTTAQSLHLLDEAITNLHTASGGDDVVRHVLSVVSMANNALLGTDHWEQSLSAEYTAWAGLGQQSGTAAQFQLARDQVVAAGQALRRELDQWTHHRVDASTASRLAHPLAHACEQQRTSLTPH